MSAPAIAPEAPLARALDRRREHYNALFASARHSYRQLDAEAFGSYLATTGNELLAWAEGAGDEAIDALTLAFYDIALEGVGTRLLGPSSRLPVIDACLGTLLSGPNPLLLARPRRVLASLINGLHSLATTPGGRPEQWTSLMKGTLRVAATVDPSPSKAAALWLESGQVAAWRAGMACYREGALRLARTLPEALALAALGLESSGAVPVGVLLDRLEADPWLLPGVASSEQVPQGSLKVVRRVGGFVGFGGAFSRPPWLVTWEGRIYVTEARPKPGTASTPVPAEQAPACWLLSADACGATLTPSALPHTPDQASSAAFSLARNGTVSSGPRSAHLAELAEPLSVAAVQHTLAVSVPRSHHILLVASAP